MRKGRRIPAPEELPRIFDDKFILRLVEQAKLSWAANIPRLSAAIREAARQIVADKAIPSDRAVRDEIKALYSAANRHRYKETATRISKISERTRALLKTRGDRLGLAIPEPEALRDHASPTSGDIKEHALLFVYGDGDNGKGVFLNTIASVVADYAVAAAMETFVSSSTDKHPTDLAMLRGARFVYASETEEGRDWAESRIKQMTGGDRIRARFMRQDFFEYLRNSSCC